MKKMTVLSAVLAMFFLLAGCGNSSGSGNGSVDGETSATAAMLPLAADVTVRVGTEPDGEILLDSATMEGFFASDDYTDETPYGFALVLTNEGKKSFRSTTRELAKEQSPVTLWAGKEAICSPVITTMLNTKYVILSISSVTDEDSYQHVVDALSAE